MPLKVELKPDERLIVGDAVIRNGDQRIRLYIEGTAPILREKDFLPEDAATMPSQRIYVTLQSAYLRRDIADNLMLFARLANEFLLAHPESAALVAEINNAILSDQLYKALKAAKRLVAFELESTTDELRGERLRQERQHRPISEGT